MALDQGRCAIEDRGLVAAEGKSFAAALRAVVKCVEKRTQYIILSKGERQSRMFMEKVKDFCTVFKEFKFLRGV